MVGVYKVIRIVDDKTIMINYGLYDKAKKDKK